MNKQVWWVWGLDVWGNGEEGYEVNDRHRIGKIELPIQFTDHDIVKALLEIGLVSPHATGNDISTDGDDTILFIDSMLDGYPLFQLELMETL